MMISSYYEKFEYKDITTSRTKIQSNTNYYILFHGFPIEKTRNALAKDAADLARLSQGILDGEELSEFISRSYNKLQS